MSTALKSAELFCLQKHLMTSSYTNGAVLPAHRGKGMGTSYTNGAVLPAHKGKGMETVMGLHRQGD